MSGMYPLHYFGPQLFVVVVLFVILVIYRIKWCQQYWKRKGLPYLEPNSIYGNIGNPFNRKMHLAFITQKMYNKFKIMGAKHGGIYHFTRPIYIPVSPSMLKNIMLRDFNHFHDRGFYYNEKDDPISAHLFAISGPKWRTLRTNLSSAFSSGKIKMMFDILLQCANNMQDALLMHTPYCTEGTNIKDLCQRYTIDVIGACAFGLDCNSFKTEDSEFPKYGRAIFKPLSRLKRILNLLAFSMPELFRRCRYKLFPDEISSFFIKVVKETVEYRTDNNVKRNDLLQLLIDLQNDDPNIEQLSITEIASQAFGFFLGGFETASTAMAFCLYELAVNQDIQGKLRKEINDVYAQHGEKLTYDALGDMNYLECVINESLRKYPPLPLIVRKCVEDYRIPETDILLEKGTKVFIPVLGLQYDSNYFPNPDKFDPERFSDINRSKILPFTFIPFGEGPRMCIGLKFGYMQMKVALAQSLRNYMFTVNPRTANPLKIHCHGPVLATKGSIWLNIKRVRENEEN